MVKGFDLRWTEIDRARDIDWTVNLESSLVELSEIIKQGSWTQWLDQADEAELVCNRDELRLLLTTFESLSEAMEDMAGESASVARVFFFIVWRNGRKKRRLLLLFFGV